MFTDISPFFFSAQPDGTIGLVGTQAQLNTTVTEAHTRGLKVLPSITDGSGKLDDGDGHPGRPASRTQHIANIVNLVMSRGFDGVDLDYEGFAFTDGVASWDDDEAHLGRVRHGARDCAARQWQVAVGHHPADVDGGRSSSPAIRCTRRPRSALSPTGCG